VAPRRKQGDLGTGKSYRLVGYSSHHKGGYELCNQYTDRVVIRGGVHSLTFYPEDATTHTDTHTQAQDDNASSDTAIIYEERMAFRVAVVQQTGHSELDALRSDSRTTRLEPFCQKNSVGLLRYPKKSIFLQGIDWRCQNSQTTRACMSNRGPNTGEPGKGRTGGQGKGASRPGGEYLLDIFYYESTG